MGRKSTEHLHDLVKQGPALGIVAKAPGFQLAHCRQSTLSVGAFVTSINQLLEQAAKCAHLESLQPGGLRLRAGGIKRSGTEIAEQGVALFVMQDVVGIEITVQMAPDASSPSRC